MLAVGPVCEMHQPSREECDDAHDSEIKSCGFQPLRSTDCSNNCVDCVVLCGSLELVEQSWNFLNVCLSCTIDEDTRVLLLPLM